MTVYVNISKLNILSSTFTLMTDQRCLTFAIARRASCPWSHRVLYKVNESNLNVSQSNRYSAVFRFSHLLKYNMDNSILMLLVLNNCRIFPMKSVHYGELNKVENVLEKFDKRNLKKYAITL
jgi:hypothetical protein